MTKFGLFRMLLSPFSVVALVSMLSFAMYFFASVFGGNLHYFQYLVSAENLLDRSSGASFLWFFLSLTAFSSGVLFVKLRSRSSDIQVSEIDKDRAVHVLLMAFFFTAVVALLWIGGTVTGAGGFSRLAALAASDNVSAREAALSASFPGGRLISSGFIGLAVFSAMLLGSGATRRKPLLILVLVTSLAYLGVKPILVSGRIDFFAACIGSFAAASLSARKIIGFKYLVPGALALSAVWLAKEHFTLGHVTSQFSDASIAGNGAESLLFYFYNDLLNALNTIGRFDGHYTFGWYSLRFVFFFTFSDKLFQSAISESQAYIGNWVTAGEVPMLAAPIVDFGPIGLFHLFVLGAICQYAFRRSARRLEYAALYGLIFATLLMSIHNSMITSQEVVYSAILIKFMAWRSVQRRQSCQVPRIKPLLRPFAS